MKDQHQKIKGYRDLTQEEIDLMNRVKQHAEKTSSLLKEVEQMRMYVQEFDQLSPLTIEQHNESLRCLALAKTNLQTGQMWFVRAVALPNSF